jgi:phosphonate transport system substrate-binding protein
MIRMTAATGNRAGPIRPLTRRRFLGLAAAGGLLATGLCRAEDDPIRIGITPVFLTGHTSLLRDWRNYLEQRLGRPVLFVQRDTYREIMDSLLAQRLEFAWICGYPYLVHRTRLRLAAVPLYQGAPLYRAYFIVPADDIETTSLAHLRGRIFAYSDPDSNSGFLVPRYRLARAGINPKGFFRKAFFTAGHRNVVEAVAVGLAAGGSVDGYVWDILSHFEPALTDRTRIVDRSQPFGFPPFVAGPSASAAQLEAFSGVLLAMGEDPAATSLLERLKIDGFTPGTPALYDGIKEMLAVMGDARVP